MQYWLLKTEPGTFSIDDLKREGTTSWTGVRNFAARNHIRAMKKGDAAFIYHSGTAPAVVGQGKVASLPYIEVDNWSTVDISFSKKFAEPISRKDILDLAIFKGSALARQGRLSVVPLSKGQYEAILK